MHHVLRHPRGPRQRFRLAPLPLLLVASLSAQATNDGAVTELDAVVVGH